MKHKIRIYAIYWAGYALLFSLIQGVPSRDFGTALINELCSLPPKVLFVALSAELLMNRLFLRGQTATFILLTLPLLLLFAFLQRLIDNFIIIAYFLPHWQAEPLLSHPPFIYNAIKLQLVMGIPFSFKLFAHWNKEKERAHEVERINMQTELAFLRNQFHPHFLFNVLNMLYEKVLSQSPDAPDAVLKIAALLRFSVYELHGKPISLHKEIQYLRNYIDLQQMRFYQRLELSFTVQGVLDGKGIEPLLLLPFVENSFKHCMNEETGWITIFIDADEEWVTAQIENSVGQKAEGSHGVGLAQVRRRLELLYPNTHTLKISHEEASFFVMLKVPIFNAIH
jgi:hypothetical protein